MTDIGERLAKLSARAAEFETTYKQRPYKPALSPFGQAANSMTRATKRRSRDKLLADIDEADRALDLAFSLLNS